jgi:hypothetical protein
MVDLIRIIAPVDCGWYIAEVIEAPWNPIPK